jgi:hypothetical protein
MTITKDPSTTTSHQPEPHPLDPETTGRSDKQSPNRAGIPMPGVARADSANGPNGPSEVDRICRYACTQKVF